MGHKFRTVGDLKKYLESNDLSPESLSKSVPVSNMTWRRLLRKPSNTPLSEKYRNLLNVALTETTTNEYPTQLDPLTVIRSGMDGSENDILSKLERDGSSSLADSEELKQKLNDKLSTNKLSKNFIRHIKRLASILWKAKSPAQKAIAAGALIYFINPFDLITDAVAGIGFIDDIGVVSLALNRLIKSRNKKTI